MSREHLSLSGPMQDYLRAVSLREHPVLSRLRVETDRLGEVATMQINPEQGQFMAWLIQATGVQRVLEIGTFTGYSALVCALALPQNGQLITCDRSQEWTQIARDYWQQAGVAHKITLLLGRALSTLERLLDAQQGAAANTFDLAFIDGDKKHYDDYYECCLRLVRPGGLILIDNTLWRGELVDETKSSETAQRLRTFNLKLHQDQRIDLSLLPIGDGLTLVRRCWQPLQV